MGASVASSILDLIDNVIDEYHLLSLVLWSAAAGPPPIGPWAPDEQPARCAGGPS